jgi:predicted nucleotidyltransferase component of viral defense system
VEKVFKQQVSLLLNVLPEIAKENCFALHGGTAINLFIRNMPRLSVDIDLTYLPVEDRETSLKHITAALQRIRSSILKVIPTASVNPGADNGKLLVSANGVLVKIEVSLVNRGSLQEPNELELCEKAQNSFDAYCLMPVVPIGQLFGGKIVAALDRQHPRDLFDVKYMLENEGFTNQIKEGFIFFLLCSERPLHELLSPNFKDQRSAHENQFLGMTEEPFDYDDFESTREKLVQVVSQGLTQRDKAFLLSVNELNPDWSVYNFQKFPSVLWKMQNLRKLGDNNPEKYKVHLEILKEKFSNS